MSFILMAVAAAPLLTADFSREVGKIRPELHSSSIAPTIESQTAQDLADVYAMGFRYARIHDWSIINGNQRVCDPHHLFPLMHLDAKDPKNYYFEATDYLLKRVKEEPGRLLFYRLGPSIEHSGKKVHFNTRIPTDFDKMAEIFAGTVRHYNRGWANGFNWDIGYWEIWNEPEGIENQWCPPEGIEGLTKDELRAKRAECRALFVRFFVKALKRLKDEFGDTIKVGGPALQEYRPDWFREIFAACRAAGVAPDFISWHGYANDPLKYNREAEAARALCVECGFPKCGLIVDEWHYFGRNYNWDDMQRCSDPLVKARIWEGPDSHNGIRSACFSLATLANVQRSKLDLFVFYGCRHVGSWGFKDSMQKKYKVFYAMKLFGDIMRDYDTICESSSDGPLTTFAVRAKDGRKGLLVVNYGGAATRYQVAVKGLAEGAKARALLLDYTHDLTPVPADKRWPIDAWYEKGVLTLAQPDFHSAAFFVTFDE